MTTLREAAQQALKALEMSRRFVYADNRPQCDEAMDALRAALAQQDAPVARECSDPMCACRGGPCAECEEGEREKEIEDLRSSLYFYQRRCEALQSWQSKMRDPERTIVCDILANGKTLDPAFAGDRYTAPPQQAEPAQEPVAWVYASIAGSVALHIVKPVGVAKASFIQSKLDNDMHVAKEYPNAHSCTPLYTAPPQRKPLTEEEIVDAVREADLDWQAGWTLDERAPNRFVTLARATIAKATGEQP